jgi:hypothetical protein
MSESARDEALRLSKEAGLFLDYRLETPHHNERQVTAVKRLIALARQRPGWIWVPQEPTQAMLDRAQPICGDPEACNDDQPFTDASEVWELMLAAAPKPEEEA